MEVTTKQPWRTPQVKTIESRERAQMLVCSSTQWDCNTAGYPLCGCITKSSTDPVSDCENSCGPP